MRLSSPPLALHAAALALLGCGARTGLPTDDAAGARPCGTVHAVELTSLDPDFASAALVGMTALPGGDAVLLGQFAGSLDLGTEVLTSSPDSWLDTFLVRVGPGGAVRWARHIVGGDGGVFDGAVRATPTGEIVVALSTSDTIDLGGGALAAIGIEDTIVATLDADGNHMWSRRYGAAENFVEVRGAAVDASGNIVVAGTTQACCGKVGSVDLGGGALVGSADDFDSFVVAFDRAGDHLWSRRSTAPVLDTLDSVAVDGAGATAITGRSFGDFTLAGLTAPLTDEGAFVMKLDASGQAQWVVPQRATNPGGSQISLLDVQAHRDGSWSTCGIWPRNRTWRAEPLPTPEGTAHAVLAHLDGGGNHRWSRYAKLEPRQFGTGDESPFAHLAVASDGGLFVTGSAESGIDIFDAPLHEPSRAPYVARLDAEGGYLCGVLLEARYSTGGLRIESPDGGQAIVGGSIGSAELNTRGVFAAWVDLGP